MEPIASALAAQDGAKAAKDTDKDELEPKVLGESKFDRVSSFLMAVVLSAILVVGWLGLIYITNQAYASRVTAPLQIIEVFGGGGGSPEGTPGSTEKIDIAGADAAAMASNNEEPAGEFEQPSVQQLPGAMLETVVESGQNLAEVDIGPVMPSGGPVASGKRASKLGSGGPGFGFGPGDGGVAREQRWSIIYDPGQTAEEYARQLDALRVQLAVVVDQNQLHYAWNFSSPSPTPASGWAAMTTGSISSGRDAAARRPTSRFCRRRGSRLAKGLFSSFIRPRRRRDWPSSRYDTGAEARLRSG